MRIRSLLLDNLSWKLLSLTLAGLIWSGARLFIQPDLQPALGHPLVTVGVRDFQGVPIRLLSSRPLPAPLHLGTNTTHVRISGEMIALDRLTEQDVLVFVELPSAPPDGALTNRIEVRVPPSVRVLSVVPDQVVITPVPRT